MTVNEWVKLIQRQGGVCNDYMRKLNAVTNKTEMFRVLCDVNGGAWLFDLHERGVKIPIDSFLKEFKNYVNGKKVVDYPNGYSSKFYCMPNETEIIADTTLVYLLECKGVRVIVPMNHYPTIILSNGTVAEILMNNGSRINIESYGDAKYTYRDERDGIEFDSKRVRITKH